MQEIKALIPDGPDDFAAVERIKNADWKNVDVLLGPIFMCLRDASWPIYKPLCDLLRKNSFGLTPHLKTALLSWHPDMVVNLIKEFVIGDGWLPHKLSEQLFALATHDHEPNVARLALECIEKHELKNTIRTSLDLVPRDKFDDAAAGRIRYADPQMIEPVLNEILEWLQDSNRPIVSPLLDSLKPLGIMLAPHIKKILLTDDGMWKCVIMHLLHESENRDLCVALKEELKFVANSPFEEDQATGYDNDSAAKELLEKYNLND